jgi:thymidylate synthase (FAD)
MRVEYLDRLGTDLSIVNAARVSMDKQHAEFDPDSDTRLLQYLAREGHISPFFHAQLSLRVTAPIFVARQLLRSTVGLAINEVSRRYVDKDPEFYVPAEWRSRAENVKQGSGDSLSRTDVRRANAIYHDALNSAEDAYADLLANGVCPEQARMILPQSMMTTWIWTGSLAAFSRVCTLRLDSHAQAETREIAVQIADICAEYFPSAWAALMSTK